MTKNSPHLNQLTRPRSSYARASAVPPAPASAAPLWRGRGAGAGGGGGETYEGRLTGAPPIPSPLWRLPWAPARRALRAQQEGRCAGSCWQGGLRAGSGASERCGATAAARAREAVHAPEVTGSLRLRLVCTRVSGAMERCGAGCARAANLASALAA